MASEERVLAPSQEAGKHSRQGPRPRSGTGSSQQPLLRDKITNAIVWGLGRGAASLSLPPPPTPHITSEPRITSLQPSGCKGACPPAVSTPIPRASFLPPDTPRAHLESSDLHLQRNKINSTKCCLFSLLLARRQAYCGLRDLEWVIKVISMAQGAGDLRGLLGEGVGGPTGTANFSMK